MTLLLHSQFSRTCLLPVRLSVKLAMVLTTVHWCVANTSAVRFNKGNCPDVKKLSAFKTVWRAMKQVSGDKDSAELGKLDVLVTSIDGDVLETSLNDLFEYMKGFCTSDSHQQVWKVEDGMMHLSLAAPVKDDSAAKPKQNRQRAETLQQVCSRSSHDAIGRTESEWVSPSQQQLATTLRAAVYLRHTTQYSHGTCPSHVLRSQGTIHLQVCLRILQRGPLNTTAASALKTVVDGMDATKVPPSVAKALKDLTAAADEYMMPGTCNVFRKAVKV